MKKRGISEIISVLALMGAVTLSFILVLVIAPQFLQQYRRVALEASFTQQIAGFQTDASLTRSAGGDYLFLNIYNAGTTQVTVKYYIYCVNPNTGASTFVSKEENGVTISPSGFFTRVFQVSGTSDNVCYAVIEEPQLLIYKVTET